MQVFATSPVAVYSGVGNAFTRISSTEGMRALWRGVTSVVLGAGPAHAVHFGTLEAVKELAGGNQAGNNWVATCQYQFSPSGPSFNRLPNITALAGASATIASDALMNPFDGIVDTLCAFLLLINICCVSHQATDASTQVRISFGHHLCSHRITQRGCWCILCVVSNDIGYINPIQCHSIHNV